jgi:hypothetical protein
LKENEFQDFEINDPPPEGWNEFSGDIYWNTPIPTYQLRFFAKTKCSGIRLHLNRIVGDVYITLRNEFGGSGYIL